MCGLKDDSYGRDHIYVGYIQTFYDVNGINCNVRQVGTHISFCLYKMYNNLQDTESEGERERQGD